MSFAVDTLISKVDAFGEKSICRYEMVKDILNHLKDQREGLIPSQGHGIVSRCHRRVINRVLLKDYKEFRLIMRLFNK